MPRTDRDREPGTGKREPGTGKQEPGTGASRQFVAARLVGRSRSDRTPGVDRRRFALTAAGTLAAFATGCARQEGAWPSREVRVVVHAAPGGMSDTVARFTSRGLNSRLGVPVLCENRVGAMGAVAFSAVKHAAPDGYVVGYAPVELSIVPHLRYVDLALSDFDLLARHHRAPAALAVPASSPYQSLDAFLAAFRSGTRIKMGTAGPLSVWHLGALALSRRLDRSFVYAPFPGSGPATTALLGGHIDAVMAGVPEVQALVRGGAVRLIGLMAEGVSPVFPEVPTFRAHGLDLVFEAWGGFMVPRGVPADRLARLERDVIAAFSEPSFLSYCRTAGLDVQPLDAAAFRAFVADETTRYARLVREFGFVQG